MQQSNKPANQTPVQQPPPIYPPVQNTQQFSLIQQQPQMQQQLNYQQMPQQQPQQYFQIPQQQNYGYAQQNIEMPMQQNLNFSNAQQIYTSSPFVSQHTQNQEIRLLSKRDKEKKLAAIIVSFCSVSSYDSLFTTVEQKTMEGTQVLVYACGSNSVKDIYQGMRKQEHPEVVKEMLGYIKEVDPDCVVFNW
jgi:hypothetical protein